MNYDFHKSADNFVITVSIGLNRIVVIESFKDKENPNVYTTHIGEVMGALTKTLNVFNRYGYLNRETYEKLIEIYKPFIRFAAVFEDIEKFIKMFKG